MKRLFVLPLVLLLAGAGSALAQDVRYNFDSAASFAGFKTYKWVVDQGGDTARRSRRTAGQGGRRRRARAQGPRQVRSRTPPTCTSATRPPSGRKRNTRRYDTGWGYGPGWHGGGWYGGGGGITTGTTSTIYIGQLALDMYASSPTSSSGAVSRARRSIRRPNRTNRRRTSRRPLLSCSRTTRRHQRSRRVRRRRGALLRLGRPGRKATVDLLSDSRARIAGCQRQSLAAERPGTAHSIFRCSRPSISTSISTQRTRRRRHRRAPRRTVARAARADVRAQAVGPPAAHPVRLARRFRADQRHPRRAE